MAPWASGLGSKMQRQFNKQTKKIGRWNPHQHNKEVKSQDQLNLYRKIFQQNTVLFLVLFF